MLRRKLTNHRRIVKEDDAVQLEARANLELDDDILEITLKAQLRPQLVGTRTHRWGVGSPECDLEVWAEEGGQELAYCLGRCCFCDVTTNILWLGGSGSSPVHERIRGRRCVQMNRCTESEGRKLTLAQALLGLAAALSERLGGLVLILRAIDNGSGKLVQMYLDCGFGLCGPHSENDPHMQALAKAVRRLAPAAWVSSLIPADFEPACWLRLQIGRLWLDSVWHEKLPSWCFPTAWPPNSQVMVHISERSAQLLVITATLKSHKRYKDIYIGVGKELVRAHGLLLLKQGVLCVHWLGRSGLRAVSSDVRSQAFLSVCGSRNQDGSLRCVTSAIAVLGVLAAVARWFGIETIQLRPHDNGSGKLLRYFRHFGFAQSQCCSVQSVGGTQSRWLTFSLAVLARRCFPKLEARCEEVAWRCCPVDWHEKVIRELDTKEGTGNRPYIVSDITLAAVPAALGLRPRSASVPFLPMLEGKGQSMKTQETGNLMRAQSASGLRVARKREGRPRLSESRSNSALLQL